MRFQPKSDAELRQERGLIEPGLCQFEIVSAEETKSKAGNDMLKLILKVWDKNGREGTIFEYLTADFQWKLKSLCVAIGKASLYESGSITPDDLVGHSGQAEIYIAKDKTGKYGDAPKVKHFHTEQPIKADDPTKKGGSPNEPPNFDEDIPF